MEALDTPRARCKSGCSPSPAWWHWVLSIFLFPVGLLSWFLRRCEFCKHWARPSRKLVAFVAVTNALGIPFILAVIAELDRQEQLAQPFRQLPLKVKPVAKPPRPYAKGKFLLLEAEMKPGATLLIGAQIKRVHSWQRRLRAELGARTPGEVSTIVLIEELTEGSGSFGSWVVSTGKPGAMFRRHGVRFILLDATVPAIVDDTTIWGEFLARRRAGRMFVHSRTPGHEDLLKYLQQLPRDPPG